jgi:hypothetical protein
VGRFGQGSANRGQEDRRAAGAQQPAGLDVGDSASALREADRDVDRDDRDFGDQLVYGPGEVGGDRVGEADADPAGLARVHAENGVG